MPNETTYRTSNGVFDIPEDKREDFLKSFPNAEEIESFKVGKDTFDIPVDKIDSFKQEMPKAKPLKKKDVSEISSEESPSPEVGSASTPPSNELIEQAEIEGTQRPPLSIQEQVNLEKPLEGITEEEKPEIKMADILHEIRGDYISSIVKSATKDITDPATQKIVGASIGLVETEWRAGGTLTPGMRLVEFSKATAPLEESYLNSLNGEFPTEEQRDNYIAKLKVIADDLNLDLDGGVPVVDQKTKELYAKDLKEAQILIDPSFGKEKLNSFGKDVLNQFNAGSARLAANSVDLMGWAIGFNAIPGYADLAEGQRFIADQFKEDVSRKDMGITDALKEGEYGKAFGNAVLQFSESVPTLITLAMGNAAGYENMALSYLGATEAVGRYDEIKDVDAPEVAKIFNSITYGLAEAIPEKFGTSAIMQSSMGALRRGVKKEVVGDIIKQGYYSQAHKYTAMMANGMNVAVRGGIDEWSTAVTENVLDGKENPLDGAMDAFLVGMFTDVAMSAPVIATEGINTAKEISASVVAKLPKTMPVDDKVKAGKVLIEKYVVQKSTENLDDSFKGTVNDEISDLDNSVKLTTLSKEDKYTADNISKEIDGELLKEKPNPETLVSLNNKLTNIEKKSGAVVDKNNQAVIDKALKGNTPSEVISTMESIQEKRKTSYEKSFGNLDSEFSNVVDKETKEKAVIKANEALEATKLEQVEEIPTEAPKVAKKAPKEKIETKVKQKTKPDESSKEDPKVSEGVGKETPKNKEKLLKGLPGNVIEAKDGLFELNKEQVAQRDEMRGKYGEKRADELILDFVDVNDLKKYSVDPLEQITKKLEGKKKQTEGISDKDLPEIDRAKVEEEIIKKVGKLEGLDVKRKKAVQDALDNISKLGNIQFAVDDVGKKQAAEYAVKAVRNLIDAGFISIEMGAVKATDAVVAMLGKSHPNASKLINENRAEIRKIFDKEVENIMQPPTPPKEKVVEKNEEPKRKERRLGRKALDSTKLPEDFKANLSEHGIEYSVRGKSVTDLEAKEISDVYIENDRIDELKSVIMETRNDISDDTRTSLAVSFVNKSLSLSETAKSESDKKAYLQDALDVFEMDMVQSTSQAQALQSKRKWADVIAANPDLFVETVKRRQRRGNDAYLKGREEDIKTAKEVIDEFLQSDEFKRISEEKGRAAFQSIIDQAKNSKQRVERGKAKMASGLSQIAEIIGSKKNAVSENEVSPDVFKAIVEIADGMLDVGVGSIDKLMSKLKVMLRQHLSPSEIDKVKSKLLKEVNAENRIEKPQAKKRILTDLELKKLVDKLYNKMAGGTKDQARTLARDYLDRLNEGGALDEASFKDLFAKALGLEYLDAKNEAKLREMAEKLSDMRNIGENLNSLFKRLIRLETELKLAKKKGVKVEGLESDFSKVKTEVDTQIKAYSQSVKDAKTANADISEFFSEANTIFDFGATFIQGNLLTPISLMTNVIANTMWLPFRSVKNMTMHLTDMALYGVGSIKENLLEKYSDNPWVRRRLNSLPDKKRMVDYVAYSKGYFHGFKVGVKEGVHQLKTGQLPEDAYIREVGKALKPLEAWVDNIAMLRGKEKLKAMKFFNNTVEGVFGIPPEIMFRLLNLGDKPFRRAAERGRLNEIASLRGLTGVEKEQFMLFPPDDVLEDMRQAGLESTYQQDNRISDFVLHGAKKGKHKLVKDTRKAVDDFDKSVHGIGRWLVKTQIPYVKTPTNIALETIDYAMPVLSLIRAGYFAFKGDRRRATDYASRAAVGFMIDAAIGSLMAAGIMTLAPQGLEEDEKGGKIKKIRESEFNSGQEPYMINVNALGRWMLGKDVTWKADEDWLLSYKRFGILSSFMMSKAESFRGKNSEEIKASTFWDNRLSMFQPLVKSSFDQSFLAGVGNAMKAITEGGYAADSWFVNSARALSASAIPNTYSTINQYRDGVIRETKNKSLKDAARKKDELKRTFKASLFTDTGLPTKITVWGEPVNRVPDGRGIGYMLFDLTKSRKYSSTFGSKIHDLYMRTGDDSILPTQPQHSYKFLNESVYLTPELYEKLQIEIGSVRKQLVVPVVNSLTWDNMPDDQKVFRLNKAYKDLSKMTSAIKTKFEGENFDELFKLSMDKMSKK